MSNSAPHDGTVWNTDVPTDGEPHGNDYKEHQATKKAMEFVNNKEHEAIAADPSASDGGGVHSLGSSVAYFGTSTPTKRPDGDTNLAANDIDRGRVWFDSNFSPPVMKKWSGSAWVQAGNKVLNDTYFTGVNEADDGTVDLIKAGRNEADNADVAIISDAARTATNAAPTEDTGLTNKKYVDEVELIKAWVKFDGSDANPITKNGGLNIDGTITKNSTGNFTINWDTDFSSIHYAVSITCAAVAGASVVGTISSQLAGSLNIRTRNVSNVLVDPAQVEIIAVGSQ